jgi:hypothetical protein
MDRIFAGTCILLVSTGLTHAGDVAPTPLLGKSVIATWEEARVQRNAGDKTYRPVYGSQKLSIYVSTAGRVFSRFTNMTSAGTGSNEQVAGQNNASRVPSFGEKTMEMLLPFASGGARRVKVEFNAAFDGCEVKITYEAPSGGAPSVGFSPITKKWIEFDSIIPREPGCSVQSGNVFGDN